MSLSGLRDMSLILTPPLNRKAVHTFISPFHSDVIKQAVLKERERKGQIIFIHNRITSLPEVERKLKALLPSVRIRLAHGKMKGGQEKMVLDFFQQKFDLLLCTTIVESGMDFTQAGTLFIDRAEQFGLSELHQLRGRVGRYEKTRLIFYKKLSIAQSEKEVEDIKTELEDFAGALPEETNNLILLSHCRWLAKHYHIRELVHRPPFLYISLANTTPISADTVVQWVKTGICEWQDKETLKFPLPEQDLLALLDLLKKIGESLSGQLL